MKRALVLSLICVLGLAVTGFAATLNGYWDTDVSIDPQQTNFNDAISLTSELEVVYTVGDWTFTSDTTLSQYGWVWQDFYVSGVLGAFSIASELYFDPNVPAFEYWQVNADVAIAGVSFGAEFDLWQNDADLWLTASGMAGDISIDVELVLGYWTACDFDFSWVIIEIGFPFCCADIAAEIMFDCDGFQYIAFETGGIAIPNLPWLTIDVDLFFAVDYKYLELTPNFTFGDIVCFDLDIDVAYTGGGMSVLSLNAFEITGIGLTCDIGAVTFSGYSDFLALPGGYWEWYNISTNDDGCCGPFAFDLTFYFLEGGLRLFDIALIDAYMELQVASQFTFDMGLSIDVNSQAFTSWTIGFLVTW